MCVCVQKVQVYLFDKVVVVTRPSGQGQQVYRQPIPVSQLVVEDLADGEARMGSFRSAFGQGSTGMFTSFEGGGESES